MTLHEFIHMGGYAFYVWNAYGIALVVLTVNVVQPIYRQRRLRARLVRRAARGSGL
ncbi:MAG: heme exporter protein CcmD [Gammaproteobacteria bacterium]|jgi:heme exporter protein D